MAHSGLRRFGAGILAVLAGLAASPGKAASPLAGDPVYVFTVVTGNLKYAGTEASLLLKVWTGDASHRQLVSEFWTRQTDKDEFERGHKTTFRRAIKGLSSAGDITAVSISRGSKGARAGWYLNTLTIQKEGDDRDKIRFVVHRWLPDNDKAQPLIRTPETGDPLTIDLGQSIYLPAGAATAGSPDRDSDTLDDTLEFRLADALKPMLAFDAGETARMTADPIEPVTLFQVRPSGCAGRTCDGQTTVKLFYVVLFRQDGGYPYVENRDLPQVGFNWADLASLGESLLAPATGLPLYSAAAATKAALGPVLNRAKVARWCQASPLTENAHSGDVEGIEYTVDSEDHGRTWRIRDIAIGGSGGLVRKVPEGDEPSGVEWFEDAGPHPDVRPGEPTVAHRYHPVVLFSRGKHHAYFDKTFDEYTSKYSKYMCADSVKYDAGARVLPLLRGVGGLGTQNVGEPEDQINFALGPVWNTRGNEYSGLSPWSQERFFLKRGAIVPEAFDYGAPAISEKWLRVSWHGPARYEITLWTGEQFGANTHANVTLSVVGGGHTTVIPFSALSSGHQPFQPGMADTFLVPGKDDPRQGQKTGGVDMGDIQSISLTHDGTGSSPRWFVEFVRIVDNQQHRAWLFYPHRWVDAGASPVTVLPITVLNVPAK